jgi:hypothetical protein
VAGRRFITPFIVERGGVMAKKPALQALIKVAGGDVI